ncbi:hypothetical protein [Demequina sp. NBRC 110053]|uniref:hypothetical protein n=1 Tax=Demequina sp. NBRC 110053 TaxID=1570342 RepID=UPI0009FD906B|nr:hypothetical protein [Demequina sp. NBRC 110053]
MSDVPESRPAAPSAEELERKALPAHLRRAPRYGRIIGTGAVAGFVVGFLCGMILPNSTGVGRGTVGLVVGFGFACFAGLIAALVAVWLDRDSPGYVKRAKERDAAVDWVDEADPTVAPASAAEATSDDEPTRASAPHRDEENR